MKGWIESVLSKVFFQKTQSAIPCLTLDDIEPPEEIETEVEIPIQDIRKLFSPFATISSVTLSVPFTNPLETAFNKIETLLESVLIHHYPLQPQAKSFFDSLRALIEAPQNFPLEDRPEVEFENRRAMLINKDDLYILETTDDILDTVSIILLGEEEYASDLRSLREFRENLITFLQKHGLSEQEQIYRAGKALLSYTPFN